MDTQPAQSRRPQCTGCSADFAHLVGDRCEPCVERSTAAPTIPRTSWPLCKGCGRRFEYLSGASCILCKADESTAAAAMPPPPIPSVLSSKTHSLQPFHFAMANPANSRTHSAGSFINPHQPSRTPAHDGKDPRARYAQDILNDMSEGYINAIGTVNPGVIPAKPKFGTAGVIDNPIRRINVRIKKVENIHSPGIKTTFKKQMTEYTSTISWVEVLEDLRIWLDGVYEKRFNFRIHELSQFSVGWTKGGCEVTGIKDGATLGDVWNKGVGSDADVLISKSMMKTRILDIDILVEYPPHPTVPFEGGDFSTTTIRSSNTEARRKRKASTSTTGDLHACKRVGTRGKYETNFSPNVSKPGEDIFIVKKLILGSSADNNWDTDNKSLTAFISTTEFASGKTKKAFKLRFAGGQLDYAAKCFFATDKEEPPSAMQNQQHLKEELLRLFTIKKAVGEFTTACREANVSAHDITIPDAFIIVADNDSGDNKAWLVDPLLTNPIRKFSGTNEAGNDTDFAAETCNAFAHFALVDSAYEFVPVDIQGIKAPVITSRGLQGADTITLFDFMTHSAAGTMGLGDGGIEGMKNFCTQHKCNTICSRLKLEAPADILETLEEIGTDTDANANGRKANNEDSEEEDSIETADEAGGK